MEQPTAFIEFETLESLENGLLLNGAVFQGREMRVDKKRTNIPGFHAKRGRGGRFRGTDRHSQHLHQHYPQYQNFQYHHGAGHGAGRATHGTHLGSNHMGGGIPFGHQNTLYAQQLLAQMLSPPNFHGYPRGNQTYYPQIHQNQHQNQFQNQNQNQYYQQHYPPLNSNSQHF